MRRPPIKAKDQDDSLRAYLPEVMEAVKQKSASLVDVRSPAEFTGEILAPPGLPETCQRGGHIPGAKSMPWAKLANDDGTFKSDAEIKALYDGVGVTGDKPIIAYCRIGERSSHSWFALKYLLGYNNVKNYDGSWTEWGNLVRAPVEKPYESRRVHRTERDDRHVADPHRDLPYRRHVLLHDRQRRPRRAVRARRGCRRVKRPSAWRSKRRSDICGRPAGFPPQRSERQGSIAIPASISELQQRLARQHYVADRGLAVALFLAMRLKRPLFVEGESGVGKTALAAAVAAALDRDLIRLQCYEGLDVGHALYEWDYARQLLELRILEATAHARSRNARGAICTAKRFSSSARCFRRSIPAGAAPLSC